MLRTILAAAFAVTAALPMAAHAQSYTPKGPIEQKYMATGPWAVSKMTTTTPCDRKLTVCDIWYPTNLGSNPLKRPKMASGFKHPVVSWSNGTGMTGAAYEYWLKHIASWGFIVIANRDGMTLDGATVADAADYLISQGNSPSSIFYGKVDAANVGTAGHSQGGGSVVKLFADNKPPFKAYVAIHPSPSYFSLLFSGLWPGQTANGTGAIMYLNSVGDGGAGDTESAYYNPTTSLKTLGVLANAKHDDVQGNPTCTVPSCITGVYGYLGYPTAWLMWRLQGATDGQAAFNATSGEFMQPDDDWALNRSNAP